MAAIITIDRYPSDSPELVPVMTHLLKLEMYDPTYDNSPSGLRQRLTAAMDPDCITFSDLWVARKDQVTVGVAMLTYDYEDVLHVFVAPQFRRQGIGYQLVQAAQAVHDSFCAHYTETSRSLFARACITDFAQM